MLSQLTELLDGRYGEIVEMWFDGGWDKRPSKWNIPALYDLVHRLQSDCATAVNVTRGYPWTKASLQRFRPDKYKKGMPIRYFPSDFRLWDPHFPQNDDPKLYKHKGELYYLPFEATIRIRNMNYWFWDTKYREDPLVSARFIADKYAQLTAQNNVLVVNVAPDIRGKQDEDDVNRLLEAADLLGIRKELI